MLDYGALPPEINSGRIYVGAGPGPLLAAAAAWDGLAAELHSNGSVLHRGDLRVDCWLARSIVRGHGGGGRTVCGVDERYCGTG